MHTPCKQSLFIFYLLRCSEHSVTNNTGLQYMIHFFHSLFSSFLYTSHHKIGKKVLTKNRKTIFCTDLRLLYFPTVILFSKSVSFLSRRYSTTRLRLYKNHSSFYQMAKICHEAVTVYLDMRGKKMNTCSWWWLLECSESGEEMYTHTSSGV